MIRFACPRCKAVLDRPEQAAGSSFPCPGCGQFLQVPAQQQPASGDVRGEANLPAQAVSVSPPHVFARPEAVDLPSLPPSRPRDDSAWPPPAARRRPLDLDDSFEDDFGTIERRSGRTSYTQAVSAKAAVVGFICSLGGMGLLFADLVMWIYTMQTHPGRGAQPLVVVMLILDLAAFVLGIVGIIFGSRGLDPSNTYNRGFAVTALVLGIIAVVISSLAGLFLLCMGMLVMHMPW